METALENSRISELLKRIDLLEKDVEEVKAFYNTALKEIEIERLMNTRHQNEIDYLRKRTRTRGASF